MEPRPNSGALFANSRKASDTHPDATGTLSLELTDAQRQQVAEAGRLEVRLAAWWRKSKAGDREYLSLKASEQNGEDSAHPRPPTVRQPTALAGPQVGVPPPAEQPTLPPIEDSIPF